MTQPSAEQARPNPWSRRISMWLSDAAQPLLPLAGLVWFLVAQVIGGPPETSADVSTLYRNAIEDAAVARERNVHGGLVPIRKTNDELVWRTPEREELLVVSFMPVKTADEHYRDPDGTPTKNGTTPCEPEGAIGGGGCSIPPRVWVTVAPELRRFCQRLNLRDLKPRLEQYLGLPPRTDNDRIVEMWVSPEDLFRPCPDPEIDDTACSLKTDGTPRVKNVPDYRHFLLSLHEQLHRERGYPWTALGYTYDWANGEHGIGASEYMIVPGARYEVRSIDSLACYCGNSGDCA